MKRLIVQIERNGSLIPVGSLNGEDYSDTYFEYLPEYLSSTEASAISVSLPLRPEPFTTAQTQCFFEGLLPEGFIRRSIATQMHVDENDYVSILRGLGRECLGAICVTEEHEKLTADYESLSMEQVKALAAEGASKSVELVTKAHLSLTGASGKVGLYYSAEEDKWYLPQGTAPSTHIVKQSHIRLDSIVANEQLALLTASKCGIIIPHSFIINTGNRNDSDVLFATKRYDRIFTKDASIIKSLKKPLRLHQEDFAQAMGIPSAKKYEKEPEGYLSRMFEILRKYSVDPINDQLQLWDRIVFNYLIGNTDAHIKNFSLLYSPNLKGIRLAPAYDIVSTVIYEQSTREMSFSIGEAFSIDEINEEHFRRAAKEAGLGEKIAIKRFRDMRDRFKTVLHDSASELKEAGYTVASELEERLRTWYLRE
ncbi:MAG: type II toxin-antitoxin system HipA family toxin [Lachnospiraceae bacterium]|nr:type II toxin-antitoxin system HipA family toxin [Lachnospiraceae bacterium]